MLQLSHLSRVLLGEHPQLFPKRVGFLEQSLVGRGVAVMLGVEQLALHLL